MTAEDQVPAEKVLGDKPAGSNEVRVSSKGFIARFVRSCIHCLGRDSRHDTLVVRGAGAAVPRVLTVVEIVKRRVGNLHQISSIHTVELENKKKEDQLRRVTVLEVTLSKNELDTSDPGYQKPTPPAPRPKHNPQRKPERQERRGGQNFRGARRFPSSRQEFFDGPPQRVQRRGFRDQDRSQRWDG